MRLLCISDWGECELDWLMRCKADGHQVKWFYAKRDRPIGRGLIDIVDDWRAWMRWADIVFLPDNAKYLRELDSWRDRGGPKIIAPTVEGASWELNRTLGMKVLEKHGIEVPAYREFSDYDKAIAYVKKEDRPFVSKPCGDEPRKELSYVAKTPEDLVFMLQRWKKAQKLKGSFILQEKIDGIEMGVGGWFGPGGFNAGWEENYEEKKLMPGSLGPNTGEMGTTMRFVAKSKLADIVLKPLAGALERIGYLGCLDVNVIIDGAGKPWPLEFTNRPGWPSFLIQQALHKGDHLEWLLDLAEGRDAHCFEMDRLAVGFVFAIPDFPYSHATKKEVCGIPIYGLKPSIMDNIHPCQIMAGEAPRHVGDRIVDLPCWVSAGDYLLVATGTGETVRQARAQALRVLDNIKGTPGSPFWRIDIGKRLAKELEPLQRHGFAQGLVY